MTDCIVVRHIQIKICLLHRFLGVPPHRLNASLFSPQQRDRLWWTNFPWGPFKQLNCHLQEYLIPGCGRIAQVATLNTLTTNPQSVLVGE